MGTEKTSAATMKSSQQHRNKPPPVPPRPQHLIPVKMMSKYSSMPDILNGWKRDTNPDLVKMGGGVYSKRSIVDVIRPDCVKSKINSSAYPPMLTASNEYLAMAEKTSMSNYRDVRCSKGNNYTMLPIRGTKAGAGVPTIDKASNWNNGIIMTSDGGVSCGLNYQQPQVNGKSSKKFSCIPSRSNSKKKQLQQKSNEHTDGTYRCGGKNVNNSANGSGQISQTSWYVEDIQLSKCEINVNNATAAVDTSTATATIVPNYDRYATPPVGGLVDRRVYTSCSNNLNNNNYDSGNGGTKGNGNNISQQRTYRKPRYQQQQQSTLPQALPRTIMSSPSLSSLPPLPKSLSDASLLWETTNKKVSGYPVSRSPALSSSSSSSSRGSSRSSGVVRQIIHPKVPPPAVPRSNSISSNGDDQPKISAVYVNSLSIGGSRGVTAGADGDAIILRDERPPPPPPPRKPTSLDMKLSILRKEMHVLRQMDLSLLSQLWSLNESIHEFRQKQELLSPNSPYLNSSDEEDSGCYHSNISSQCIVTANNHNTLGSSSSRSSISTGRSTRRDSTKP